MIMAVDTNRYRDFCEGVEDAVERFRSADRILMPFPVLAELRAGFASGTLSRRNEGVLSQFLNRKLLTHGLGHIDETHPLGFIHLSHLLQQRNLPLAVTALVVKELHDRHRALRVPSNGAAGVLRQFRQVGADRFGGRVVANGRQSNCPAGSPAQRYG